MKRLILPLDPFSVTDLDGPRRQGAEYSLYLDGGAWPEQDSLQEKGMRKDLVASWTMEASA